MFFVLYEPSTAYVSRIAARRVDRGQGKRAARGDDAGVDPLIEALRNPACYPHPADAVEVVETHISWVLLAGEFAYKIKKPVRLAFLDFSTLEARRKFCEEELRLNRRTAPDLYLDVQPIVRQRGVFAFGAAGAPVEYAVRMRRFPPGALAENLAARGELGPGRIDAMAAVLAAFHGAAPRAGAADGYGTAAQVVAPALGNFDQIAALSADPGAAARLRRLRDWTGAEAARLAGLFAERRATGCIRECHGDLHLGNIAFLDGHPVPFDCIEFDPALRWIDVMSEVAFLVMDLQAHGLAPLGWRVLNAWLEATGDYAGIGVLRYYLVYRAMVRAKIAALRNVAASFGAYLALAESLAGERRAAMVAMHGLSGSGKTTVALALLERLHAVRLRSDVERKRLHGIEDPRARTGVGLDAGIYSAAASGRTYERLAELARRILQAGYPAVVDAAFLRRAERDRFRRLAQDLKVGFLIAACDAPPAELRRRLAARQAEGRDASDAHVAVLEHQLVTAEALAADEADDTLAIDTASDPALRLGLDRAAARLMDLTGARDG
jgi:aminoglycoside phosphotransferase family enzyme/predicted kinase